MEAIAVAIAALPAVSGRVLEERWRPMQERYWQSPLSALLSSLEASPEGLSEAEAALRLRRFGPNLPTGQKADGRLQQFIGFFANPLVLILLVAATLAASVGEVLDALIIASIILASVLLNFVQAYRSNQAAETLRRSVATTLQVVRSGIAREVPVEQVVPGDVFLLAAGDVVPADGRLLEAKDLFVDQGALTGESLPAEKHAEAPAGPGLDQADNAVFAGSSVVSGTARAVAVHTGRSSELGGIAAELTRRPPPTEFERGMTAFSLMILRIILALVMTVFLALALLRHDPLEALLFSIALAVGLTPEFLPMILTVTLTQGAMRMARKRVVVKQLAAIENFGSIDVLCSDKTGTLTEGAIVLERYVDPFGADDPGVLRAAVLNSMFETGIRSPLDAAILKRASEIDVGSCLKRDEIPFDFHRRRLSVVVDVAGRPMLITKGAPEAVLPICVRYRARGSEAALDPEARDRIEATFRQLSMDGLRVLGIAERAVADQKVYTVADEADLVFVGFAAFLDPPREGVAETLRALAADGIRVVILTGDNEWVTRKICREVGLDGTEVVLGSELDRVSPEALPRLAERVSIFARLAPEQKDRVVRALKSAGHVVGYLGDGINDAPSLRVADVGISVQSAANVAKEAAPIILMDKSLGVLHEGVLEGRRSFANVIKYVMMGTSSNFGNMFSMAGAALVLPFLPMLPMQILLNNLLYDASQIALPGDRVDAEAVGHPRRWNIRFIRSFMVHLGPLSSVFDLLTFGLLLGVFHASAGLFRTGWFLESLWTQTLVVFVIRTRFAPWLSRPSRGLVASVGVVLAIALALPYSPLAPYLGFEPLPPLLVLAILAMTVLYLALAEGVKRAFYRSVERA